MTNELITDEGERCRGRSMAQRLSQESNDLEVQLES